MAIALPDGPRGRALALGMTAATLGLLWLAVAQPQMNAYQDGSDALQRREALAERMSGVADSLPQRQKEAKATQAAGPPVSATLDGTTDALAAANLDSLVEGMDSRAGAHVTSTEALPAEAVGEYRRISLRISVDATWVVLVHLLQAIEQ